MSKPEELFGLSDDELLLRVGRATAGSADQLLIYSEFQRRAFVAMRKAAEAQLSTAEAAERTLLAAMDTAWWTRVSAIAIALSVFVMAIGTCLDWIK